MPLTQQKRDYLLWMNRKKENTFPEYSEIEWKRRYRNGTSKRSSKPYQKTLKIESREPKKKKIFFSKLGPWEPKNNIAILGTESLLFPYYNFDTKNYMKPDYDEKLLWSYGGGGGSNP